MSPFEFVKAILATWYIAHAVTGTHGPGGIFEWMREKLPHGRHGEVHYPVTSPAGEHQGYRGGLEHNGLLDCIICFAPWVAAVMLLMPKRLRNVLAMAGGALLLHSFTGWRFGE